jgi:Protein of unknown function (DUF3102)
MATKKTLTKASSVVKFEDLPRLINKYYDACQECWNDSLAYAVKVGKYLTQAQKSVPHAQWSGWLNVHCPNIPQRTTQHYMRMWENRKLIVASGAESMRDAFKLITKPKPKNETVSHSNDSEDEGTTNKQQPLLEKRRSAAQTAHTAISSDDDEETTAPQGKVTKSESQKDKLERKKYQTPVADETINKDNEKDEIIAKLEKELTALKAKLSRLTGNKPINISKRDLRSSALELAKFLKDDIELANEICQIIMVEVTAVLEAKQSYADDEF